MNRIGAKVRDIREKQGLTQEQSVARCNIIGWDISRSTLSKIELNVRRITDIEVVLLAKALNVSIQDLFESIE